MKKRVGLAIVFMAIALLGCSSSPTGHAALEVPTTYISTVNVPVEIDLSGFFPAGAVLSVDFGEINGTTLTYVPMSVGEHYIVASSGGESVLLTVTAVGESLSNQTSQSETSSLPSRETADERETFDRGIAGDLGECTTVNASSTLTADISASGSCILIATSDVVFDCNGHVISWDTGAGNSASAVLVENMSNITVKNCVLRDLSVHSNRSIGINLTNTNLSTLLNNTIQTNGTTHNYGIILQNNSNNNTVTNNTIRTNGTTDNYGIHILISSHNNTINNNFIFTDGSAGTNYGIYLFNIVTQNIIANNTIATNGTTSNSGIYLSSNAHNNTISNNSINTNGTTTSNYGIAILSTVFENIVRNNSISTYGSSSNHGMYLQSSADNNSIFNNTIQTNGTAGTNYGIYIFVSGRGNNVINNTIRTNGTSNNVGIRLETAAGGVMANNTLVNNNLQTNGTSSGNRGIYLFGTGVIFNLVANNTIQTSGTSINLGIQFSSAYNNTAINNTITTTGTSTDNYGVSFASTSAVNNTIINSSITTNGTANNTGIRFDPGGNKNLVANVTITTGGTNSSGIGFVSAHNNTLENITLNNTLIWITTQGSQNNTLSNITFLNANGSIRITAQAMTNQTEEVNQSLLNITNNTAFLNSTNLTWLNTTAQITLNTITWADPRPLVSGNDDGAYINCSSSTCTEHSYAGGIYVFNVTGFTTYSSEQNASSCERITSNTTLINNVSATATCITVGANNIVLDCNGYSITWDTGAGNSASAVLVENMSNITVKNCVLRDLSVHSNRSVGINLTNTNLSLLLNNTIQTNGTTHNYGLILQNNSNNNTVTNNTIRTNGTTDNYGIHILTNSHNNTLFNNTITTNGTGQNDAIRIDTNSNNNTVVNNTLATVSSSSYAVFILSSSDNVFVNTTLNATTDWIFANAQTTNNFTNTTFQNANGSIRYNGTIVINALTNITQNKTNITNNKAYVNTTNLTALNTTAQITLLNVNYTDPQPVRDTLDDGTYKTCAAPTCIEQSYSGTTFTFNVTGFTAYTATESVLNTPQTINQSATLTMNLSSNSSAVNLSGNDVELDCRGFIVTWNSAGNSQTFAVTSIGKNNVSVRNCAFVNGSTNSFGFNFTNTSNITVTNVTLRASSDAFALVVENASANFTNVTFNNSANWITTLTNSMVNLTNVTFRTENGTILFPSTISLDENSTITQTQINISNKTVFVNSTNLSAFNTTAQITFFNMTEVDPTLYLSENGVNFTPCSAPTCTKISYSAGTATFNVSHFSTYVVSEAGINLSFTKNDSADPVTVGDLFTYSIIVTINESTATNVTVIETYPSQVTYYNSQPVPVSGSGNANFSLGNMTNTTFIINITVRAVTEGTALNIANITFLNVTNQSQNYTVNESTTIANSGSALGGGAGRTGGGGSGETHHAAQTIDLVGEAGSVVLKKGDILNIIHKNVRHTVSVLEFTEKSAIINVQSEPQDFTLSLLQSRNVDLDEDGNNDLYVKLDSIDAAGVHLKIARVGKSTISIPLSTEQAHGMIENNNDQTASSTVPQVSQAKLQLPKNQSSFSFYPYLIILSVPIIFLLVKLVRKPVVRTLPHHLPPAPIHKLSPYKIQCAQAKIKRIKR